MTPGLSVLDDMILPWFFRTYALINCCHETHEIHKISAPDTATESAERTENQKQFCFRTNVRNNKCSFRGFSGSVQWLCSGVWFRGFVDLVA